jgi:hypothetical protein
VWFAACCCASAALALAASAHAQPARHRVLHQADDAVYAYTDDRGRLVYANRLDDVPLQLRAYARRVDQPAAPEDSASMAALLGFLQPRESSATHGLYRYKSRAGRAVFTNLLDQVPPDQRPGAAVDLAHVSLNSELGAELDQRLKSRFEALRESSVCRGARSEAQEPWWKRAATEHRSALTFAAALLVFLLLTPTMSRRFGGAAWARALSLAIPVLGLGGIISFMIVQAGHSATKFAPESCDEAAWASAGKGDQPIVQRLKLVSALDNQIKVLEQVHAESE